MSFATENNAALRLLAQKANSLNAKDNIQDAAINAAQTTANTAQGTADSALGLANGAATIDDTNPTGTKTAYSASKTEALVTTKIAEALEGEDISDLSDAITASAAKQVNLATNTSVEAVADGLSATNANLVGLSTAIGDLANYDPLKLVTDELNF